MSNEHDANFKQLMAERTFFEPFLKSYLPTDLLHRIDWPSVEFYKMGGTHRSEKKKMEFESDVIYLARLNGKKSFIWVHCEHQSSPDPLIVLRVLNYQVAELLAYAKQNPGKHLPGIITLIYHQGQNPWPHSLEIQDLFAEPELAMKYFGRPILIDLPIMPDEELQRHQNIGPVEIALKYVRQQGFNKNMEWVLKALRTVDDKSRRIVLQYLIQVADVSEDELIETAKKCLPRDEGVIMTVAEQLIERGVRQGHDLGLQEGISLVAKNLLANGLEDALVEKSTGLSHEVIVKLRKEIRH